MRLRLEPRMSTGYLGNQVHVVTSVSPEPCETVTGNYLITLSLKNKMDYAALKPGFEFHWYMGVTDKELTGMWTKVAVLQNLLSKMTPNPNQWLLWVDSDTMFVNTTVAIPFDEYEGKDLVLWDGAWQCLDIQDAQVFNAGILLFRNSNWTRNFLRALIKYNQPEWREGGERFPELCRDLAGYKPSLYEQAAMVHLWTTHPELKERILCPAQLWNAIGLEPFPKGYGGMHAQYADFKDSVGIEQGEEPLLAHWPGCQLCSPRFSNFDAVNCTQSFMDIYSRASKSFYKALGKELPMSQWGISSSDVAQLTHMGYSSHNNNRRLHMRSDAAEVTDLHWQLNRHRQYI